MNQAEEMDAFLCEVDFAKREIDAMTSGEITTEEFDKRVKAKEERKKREEQKYQKWLADKEAKIQQAKLEGKKGKGDKDTYKHFCKYCHREYQIETPKCYHCKKDTVVFKDRYAELVDKCGAYKEKKTKRAERKQKWNMWKKTQAMLWKKSSTNYSKWDYYTTEESEEEEKGDPIVPEDDPQFKAMEMDINERAKKRQAEKLIAEEYKQKGNDAMTQGDYNKAWEMYTFGLDHKKDYKALWTNRALANIKLGKFKACIKDCTRILEYSEVFEEGYVSSKKFNVKAFLRRAFAHKERKNYKEALEDVEEALKLYPQEKEGLDLKKEVEEYIKHQKNVGDLQSEHKKIKDQKIKKQFKEDQALKKDDKQENKENGEKIESTTSQDKEIEKNEEEEGDLQVLKDIENINHVTKEELEKDEPEKEEPIEEEEEESPEQIKERILKHSYKEKIDDFINKKSNELTEKNITEIAIHITFQKEAQVYFYEKKGIKKCIELVEKDKRPYILLSQLLEQNHIYMEQFMREQGTKVLYEKIEQFLEKKEYEQITEILEIFSVLCQNEKHRNILKADEQGVSFVKSTFNKMLEFIKTPHIKLVSNYIIFISNLCYSSQSKIQEYFESELYHTLSKIFDVIRYDKKKSSKYEILRENCYNFITNLLTEESTRNRFRRGDFYDLLECIVNRLSTYNSKLIVKRTKVTTAALGLFWNLAFQGEKSEELQTMYNQLNIGDVIMSRFLKLDYKKEEYTQILERSIAILSKLDFKHSNLMEKISFPLILKFMDEHSIDIGLTNKTISLLANLTTEEQKKSEFVQKISKEQQQDLIIKMKYIIQRDDELRFCNICTVAGNFAEIDQSYIPLFREIIPRLITVAKDKTGNMRKNSAIFIAKLSKDQENLDVIRSLHGIEVLNSIFSQVYKK